MRATEADVVVVGAGPAGSVFSLNLSPFRRVLMIDRAATPGRRIGESLVPAARRLFRDMGLWEDFLAEGHPHCHGKVSVWGGDQPVEQDSLIDLDGPGWHLDRARFDLWLRQTAVARGAALLAPAELKQVTADEKGWRLVLATEGRQLHVRTRLLVDAAGRHSHLARRLGARRSFSDRLVCRWVYGRDIAGRQSGMTHLEAEPDGWWYTAPLSDNRRVLAFHTDADLPAAVTTRTTDAFLKRLGTLPFLSGILADSGFNADADSGGLCAAHSTTLTPAVGDAWLAVGDAALGFDPLSSQGLFQAIHSGLAAAEAADRHLSGTLNAFGDYQASIDAVGESYRSHLRQMYALEKRWTDRPFWHRRLGP